MTYNAPAVCRRGGCPNPARSNILVVPDADQELCVEHCAEVRALRKQFEASRIAKPLRETHERRL